MATSIKDIAKLAGVSVATVARALKNKPDVKKETRETILALAKKHNYQPNILARSLVTRRTYTVGIIVPDLANPFFPALIKGLEATLWANGYSVILADTDYDAKKEIKAVNDFISRRVDGIIMSPIETQDYREWLDQVKAAEMPFVSLTKLRDHDADTVVAADRYGARAATEHLLDLARTKILYLGNAESTWANGERIDGYREALREAGISLDRELIKNAARGTMDMAYQALSEVMDAGIIFDAVIAFDDYMALGVKKALAERNVSIPDDIALVGFDNLQLSSLPEISLTTVDIPKYDLGKVSAQLVMERIEEEADEGKRRSPFKEIVLNPSLVVRASTTGIADG